MLEVVRVTTLHSNNVNMNVSGKVLRIVLSPPNVSSSSLQRARWTRANCEMRVVVSPKITRVGVDNSATWFVDGMIHRQRRK